MLRQLEGFAKTHPDVRVKVSVSGDPGRLTSVDALSYGEDMMASRIAVVPRGTALESYRLFEAWRYGCVVVCEALPRTRLYADSPRVTVRAWRELPGVLRSLLSDEERQHELHRASLRWWEEVCSEEAVGRSLLCRVRHLAEDATRSGA